VTANSPIATGVTAWLRGLGLEQYAPAFHDNDIDGAILAELTADDLIGLGIASVGHRRKLLAAISTLRKGPAPESVPPPETNPRETSGPAGPADIAPAERRQVTIMFCDLVASTALSARLDPEDMREIIGAYHRCCTEQITKAGGFVAKYMGDGVLAYFGYPQAHEDDAERAVRGGLAVADAVPKLRIRDDVPLQVRIGIATGLVVVGDLIGEGAAQERGVVGDTPNLAARLQALAEPGQVVIAQSTRRLVGGLFDYRDLGSAPLKGLAEPVQAWQVLGPSGVLSRFEAQHQSLTSLVGREEEMELLMRRWRQAAGGEGRVVLLSGEPGIGKSRLAAALDERLKDEPHAQLRNFCSPHHTDSALYPAIAQLEWAAGFERQDGPEAKLRKLALSLGPASERGDDIQLLADLLSIPTDDRYAPLNLSPQRKKEKIFDVLLRQLEGLTRHQPVLVVYEDVHWIDPSSRELLDLAVERAARLPVLLIITFRPEFVAPWTGQAHVTTLSLNRLARRDGAALVGSVAGNSALSDEIVAEIVERTDGVPLFVEELTKAVLEAATQDAAKGLAGASSGFAVPATLHASLMARLDRLGPVAKEIAQAGAAIGREFSYELLAPVAQKTSEELQSGIARLGEAGLVFARGTIPQAVFLFKHALVRDAAYSTLLRGQRQQLHGRIATALEAAFPETVAAQPELLGHHCEEAGLAAKAVEYWRRAGELAVRRAANLEAIKHFMRALALVETQPDAAARWRIELAILSRLGPALMSVHGWAAPDVGVLVERAAIVARRLDSSVELAPPLAGLWLLYTSRGQLDRAEDISVELFKIAREHDNAEVLLQAHHATWPTRWISGAFAEASAHIEAGMALYDESRHEHHRYVYMGHDPAVCALAIGASVQWMLGHPDQAARLEYEASALGRRLRHAPSLAHALSFVGEAQYVRRDGAAAAKTATELLALCDEHRLDQPRAAAMMFMGWAMARRGEVEEGIRLLEQGLSRWQRLGVRTYLSRSHCMLAEAYLLARRYAAGVEHIARAFSVAAETGDQCHISWLHQMRGALSVHASDRGAAAGEADLRQAMDIARGRRAKGAELRAAAGLARLWADQGRRAEALELLAPIYGWFSEGFDTPEMKEAKALLDQLA
jgi:class 3 adenylate cyclase/predicted ATPase